MFRMIVRYKAFSILRSVPAMLIALYALYVAAKALEWTASHFVLAVIVIVGILLMPHAQRRPRRWRNGD